ncbi:YeeE/YedE family protein [Mesoflavibacter sp.]|uniref:YeeE/YedE family protein n=1 Tax=Mesoflavibacter sp. TaxID=1930902 RepID=UPI003513CB5D
MEFFLQPWSWLLSGFLIALIMFFLLIMGKTFGMSSNLRTFCAICGGGKFSQLFNFNWREQSWNLLVVLGAILGGFVAKNFMTDGTMPQISNATKEGLTQIGFSEDNDYLPKELFSAEALQEPKTIIILIVGGLLIGFGTRYAGGCTSGHAITGLSNLQRPSLLAVIGFFIGGLIMVHLLFPLIF